jgi:nitrogen fixation/metabolism regulation signal transduction histidine kinase
MTDPIVNVSTSTGGAIFQQATSIFSGFKLWIIFIIALVLGFWLFEILIDIVSGVLARRREDADIKAAMTLISRYGLVAVMPAIPAEQERAIKEAEKLLKQMGYKIEKKAAIPKPPA